MTSLAPDRPRTHRPLASRISITAAFAPLALVFVVFVSAPLLAMAWRAFDSGELGRDITSPLVVKAMKLSAITSTITLAFTLVFGTPVAYLLARGTFRGKVLVDLLVDLPIVLPPTVAGVALLVAFGRRGLIGEHFDLIGLDIAFSTTAVVFAQIFVSAPFYIRTAKAGFEGVNPEYEGVAATLGASPLRIFRRIILPLAWPSVLAGAILCWARALSELGATLIFAGNFPGRTQTMPLAIISSFESGRPVEVAIALAMVLVVTAGALLALLRVVARRAPGFTM